MEKKSRCPISSIPSEVAIIGTGNVADHLCKALSDKVKVINVKPRKPEGYEDADLVIIAVKDDAVKNVCESIKDRLKPSAVVAHTSGSLPIDILEGIDRRGVIYPLQTFTKGIPLDYSKIPFFVEGNSEYVNKILKSAAYMVSSTVEEMDSGKRKILHLSAVFASNFTNAMVGAATRILEKSGIDADCLQPLLNQTFQKLKTLSPTEAQTGPAVRNDLKIINSHLQLLEKMGMSGLQNIYNSVSQLITDSSKRNECN